MKKYSFFTLIELLVVVGIIAILMTILLPALKKAREVSKRTVCASNEKQIGLAFSVYIGDYDDQYPLGINSPGVSQYDYTSDYDPWDILLASYLNINPAPEVRGQVLECPADKTVGQGAKATDPDYQRRSYVTVENGYCVGTWPGPGRTVIGFHYEASGDAGYRSRKAHEIIKPTLAPLISEKGHIPQQQFWHNTRNFKGRSCKATSTNFIDTTDSPHARFCGDVKAGENVLFADGHVKWMVDSTGKYFLYGGIPPEPYYPGVLK